MTPRSRRRIGERRGISGRERYKLGEMPIGKALIYIVREQIKGFDGKPLRRLQAGGRYLGVDGRIYDE